MQCDYETPTWGPHPGCREFMDAPEMFPCHGSAVSLVAFADEFAYFYDPGSDEPPPVHQFMWLCADHADAADVLEEDPSVRIISHYRLTDQLR